MKVKYIGKEKMDYLVSDNEMDMIPGKVYTVMHLDKKHGWYGIVDESGEEYGYPPDLFEIVEGGTDEYK